MVLTVGAQNGEMNRVQSSGGKEGWGFQILTGRAHQTQNGWKRYGGSNMKRVWETGLRLEEEDI